MENTQNISLSVIYPKYNDFIKFLNNYFNNKFYKLVEKKNIKLAYNTLAYANAKYNTIFTSSHIYTLTKLEIKADISNEVNYQDIGNKRVNVLKLIFSYNLENFDYTYFDILQTIKFDIIDNSGVDFIALTTSKDKLIYYLYSKDKKVMKNIENMFNVN